LLPQLGGKSKQSPAVRRYSPGEDEGLADAYQTTVGNPALAPSASDAFRLSEEPPPKGIGVLLRRALAYLTLVPGNVSFWTDSKSRGEVSAPSFGERAIGRDAFGINIAPGVDRAADDYVVERLRDIGVCRVRIDYGYGPESREHAARLIHRIADEGFSVLLHLVPPMSEAIRAGQADADERWAAFVRESLEKFRGSIEAVEVLSTPNRFTWAGFTMTGFVRWIRIGARICSEAGVAWFGPNVTDFSPIYNAGLLHRMRAAKAIPAAHTNNLFVDRAGEPENFDSKVLSRGPGHLHLDLVGKARVLAAIGAHFGAPTTISTYAYWTLDVKSRSKARYVDEETFAAYLVRYMVLATSCGALSRVYWGQMVSFAKGLVDDGSGIKPETPTVHHQWLLHGRVADYRVRPGAFAYGNLMRWIGEGVRLLRRLPSAPGTYALEYLREADGRRFLIAWTRDGMVDDIGRLVADPSVVDSAFDMIGRPVEENPLAIGPRPRFFGLSAAPSPTLSLAHEWGPLARLRTVPCEGRSWKAIAEGTRRGLVREDAAASLRAILDGADSDLYRLVAFEGDDAAARATRLFSSASELRDAGIPCEPVVAVVEESPRKAVLVVERVPGAVELPRFLAEITRRNDAEREVGMRALRLLVRLVSKLHKARMLHGGLNGDAVMVAADDHRDPRTAKILLRADATARLRVTRRAGGLRQLIDISRLDAGGPWRMDFIRCWRRKGSVRTRWAIHAMRAHRRLRILFGAGK